MYINSIKEILIPINIRVGLRGFLRYQLINKFSGKITYDTGFIPNTILNTGRNEMGTRANWLTHCHVGSSSIPPLVTDTGLLGLKATTSTITTTTYGAQSSPPYYGWKRRTYRFPIGAGQGGQNLSEAGVGWGTGPTDLISRALIVDPITQLPTTVTPLSDEILDVTYELRYYPPLDDTIQTVTLNSLVYDTITRAAEVTSSLTWGSYIGTTMGEACLFVSDWRAYDGALGGITTLPSGITADLTNVSEVFNKTYSNNSYTRGMQASLPPTSWNLTNGIRSTSIRTTGGSYKTSYTRQGGGGETIPKSSSYTMVMVWNLTWNSI